MPLHNLTESTVHNSGMKDCSGVSEEALADLAGLPGVRRHIQRHVSHYGRADYVVPGDAASDSAVIGIGAVVAHREITIVRYLIRKFDVSVAGRRASGRRRLTGALLTPENIATHYSPWTSKVGLVVSTRKSGAPGETRTPDPLLRRHIICRAVHAALCLTHFNKDVQALILGYSAPSGFTG